MKGKGRIPVNVMNKARKALKGLAYFAVIGASVLAGTANATDYEIIKLAPPDPNCNYSKVYSINNDGAVVGSYGQISDECTRGSCPHLWGKNFLYKGGEFRDLPIRSIRVINDWGDILTKDKIYGIEGITEISITGKDMNNKREVLGDEHLYLDGEIIEINVATNQYYKIRGFNDKHQVVGELMGTNPHRLYGFLWEDGVTTRIEGLWNAFGINDNGTVVGQYKYSGGTLSPGMWKDGEAIRLSVGSGTARAVNNLEQVVGVPAFIYENGEMKYLNSLIPEDSGWTALEIEDINDKGQIIGLGRIQNHKHRFAFLMNPISKSKTLSADLNNDGIVNWSDYAEFANQWLEKEDWYDEGGWW